VAKKIDYLREYERLQRRAQGAVRYAVKTGKMPSARNFHCADCGRKATAYDHRNYRKAFDVDPVCKSCNRKRGSAEPLWLRRRMISAKFQLTVKWWAILKAGGLAKAEAWAKAQ
jgi:5-methylcytosine-specific restriction endonuclease McrA